MRIQLKSLFGAFVGAIVLMCGSQAHATLLLGTSVTGTLTVGSNPLNLFDPGIGDVPGSYLNHLGPTVTIGSQPTFGEFYSGASADLITAIFTDTTLTIEYQVFSGGPYNNLHMSFTDTAFGPLSYIPGSNSFPGSFTTGLSGNTFSVNWTGGTGVTGDDYVATFSFAPATSVPEISASAIGSGIVLVAGMLMMLSCRPRSSLPA
jgi:hypothetical protein